jgi:hypothetical protein
MGGAPYLIREVACDNVVWPTHTMSEPLTTTANGNNQLVGYPYDASGNLQNDQLGHTFNYDAENRPYSAGGVTYYASESGEARAGGVPGTVALEQFSGVL